MEAGPMPNLNGIEELEVGMEVNVIKINGERIDE